MNPSFELSSTRDERVNEVVAAYLEAAAGKEPDRQEWLRRHPDLRAFFADQGRFARGCPAGWRTR
jgi:hypothetical protein